MTPKLTPPMLDALAELEAYGPGTWGAEPTRTALRARGLVEPHHGDHGWRATVAITDAGRAALAEHAPGKADALRAKRDEARRRGVERWRGLLDDFRPTARELFPDADADRIDALVDALADYLHASRGYR